MILDFKSFTKETKTPSFQLPNVNKVTQQCGKKDFMIKFDLTNGFFHINLHKEAQDLLGVKCQNKYYKIKKLPQGLSISPYLMQRVMRVLSQGPPFYTQRAEKGCPERDIKEVPPPEGRGPSCQRIDQRG